MMRRETPTAASSGRARTPSAPLPASSPVSRLRRGVTLIELMISMLILAIVCVAWLQIIGIQSARREARRREAVERLAGMMDAFIAIKTRPEQIKAGCYQLVGLNEDDKDIVLNHEISFRYDGNEDTRYYVYNGEISTICYQLKVEQPNSLLSINQAKGWWQANSSKYPCAWLVGRLYDKTDDNRPFFTLPLCFGFPVSS